ncbi:MAG: rhomboid family intramembrane serine protease [Porticoccaceae bacterium]|jgi:membrane associated rhomboid family serine protease
MTITLLLIIITVIISLLAWQQPRLLDTLIYQGPAVSRGQWWRLLSHGFIHADGAHLLFNMITLYFFGRLIEQVLVARIGAIGFVLFYLAGIVMAILPSHFRHRGDAGYRSLGASGAVSAVLFAFILLQPWAMLLVMFVPLPAIVFAVLYVAYSVWADRRGRGNVNHSAHLWGAAWGVGVLLALEPRLLAQFWARLLQGW